MNKITLLLFIIVSIKMHSQEIGIRTGSLEHNSVAIDGIVNFDDNTRLHGDITFSKGIGANLLYDFKVEPFSVNNTNFQYYLGTGLTTFIGDPFILGINGEAGVEYLFRKTPITVGIDWRPTINIITKTKLIVSQIALTIRFRINEI